MLLLTEDDKKVKRLFYATVYDLMMGQLRSKHVTVDVLQHYCYSKELCAFVGLNCGNFLICLFGTDSSCLSPAARNPPFSFQKPFAVGLACCWQSLQFHLFWGCRLAPICLLQHRFGIKMMLPDYIHRNNWQQRALSSGNVQVAIAFLAFSCASNIVCGTKRAYISVQPTSAVPSIISVI
jgi:hypothetical protein